MQLELELAFKPIQGSEAAWILMPAQTLPPILGCVVLLTTQHLGPLVAMLTGACTAAVSVSWKRLEGQQYGPSCSRCCMRGC